MKTHRLALIDLLRISPSVILIAVATATAFVLGNPGTSIASQLVIDDFESGALGPQWTTSSSTPSGRIQVTGAFGTAGGSFALLMDTSVSGPDNLNEAVWTVDLTGASQAELIFSHADFNDEENPLPPDFVGSAPGDGVAISDDGVTWHTVLNATQVPSGIWQQVSVDLAAEAAAAGMTLGPDFQIKFQQFDNFPLTTDGRGYDNLSVAGGTTCDLDIKPGSDPNSIDPFSRGVIPVAILTTEDFDALTVDADSVLFGPNEAEKAHKRAHVEDVDDDGDLDLVLHFRTQDTGIAPGDTEACVTGQTYDGVPIEGCDSVRTVPPS
jgi:hypothetical protein